jgi:flagellar hook-length control protein FliK
MNATAASITSRIAQPRAEAASVLRSDRAEGAPSFADLFAERSGLESAAPEDTTAEPTVQDAEEDADPDSAPSDEAEQPEDTAEDQPSQTARQNAGESSADAGRTVAVSVAQHADAAAATIRGVKRELTHAATVDLAKLARDELVAEPIKIPTKPPGKFPGGPGPALTAAPPHPNLSAGTGSTPPEPGVRPEPVGTEPPRPEPRATQRTDTARPTGQEMAVAASAEPARAEAARTQATARPEPQTGPVLVGRSELLTRLTGSAEAARGAIAGVDRAGGQAIDRDPRAARSNLTTPDPTPRATREQVLANVQRGLASVLTQGGGRMSVILRPEQLGEVRVRMEVKDGVVNARLSATTEAARQTIESGLDTLRAALESRGIRVESLHVDVPDPQSGGQPQANPDTRGGRHHQQQEHRPDASADTRVHTQDAVPETAVTRGIWTEVGIDAVA